MNETFKCEALRRANIYCTDLAELDQLSDSTKILHKTFYSGRWIWVVTVSNDVLPLVAPTCPVKTYDNVAVFNVVIEHLNQQQSQLSQQLLGWQQINTNSSDTTGSNIP